MSISFLLHALCALVRSVRTSRRASDHATLHAQNSLEVLAVQSAEAPPHPFVVGFTLGERDRAIHDRAMEFGQRRELVSDIPGGVLGIRGNVLNTAGILRSSLGRSPAMVVASRVATGLYHARRQTAAGSLHALHLRPVAQHTVRVVQPSATLRLGGSQSMHPGRRHWENPHITSGSSCVEHKQLLNKGGGKRGDSLHTLSRQRGHEKSVDQDMLHPHLLESVFYLHSSSADRSALKEPLDSSHRCGF